MTGALERLMVDDFQAAMRPLQTYDNKTLHELVDNDAKVEELLKSVELSTRNTMVNQNESTMAQNRSLAEYNLSMEPTLEAGKNNLKLLMQQLEEVRCSVQRKEELLRDSNSSLSTETALALLQTSAAESEEESEKIAELFYKKEMDTDEFLEKFLETRRRMHLRKVKAEKMVELVNESRVKSSQNHRRPAPLPPYPVTDWNRFSN